MTDMGIFHSKRSKSEIVSYANIGYLSGGVGILQKSTNQTLVATFSNHSEILTLRKVDCECP